MQRTALYNSRKTETQLKSENNFIVEGEMLVSACQRCLPIKKKLALLTKGKISEFITISLNIMVMATYVTWKDKDYKNNHIK